MVISHSFFVCLPEGKKYDMFPIISALYPHDYIYSPYRGPGNMKVGWVP